MKFFPEDEERKKKKEENKMVNGLLKNWFIIIKTDYLDNTSSTTGYSARQNT